MGYIVWHGLDTHSFQGPQRNKVQHAPLPQGLTRGWEPESGSMIARRSCAMACFPYTCRVSRGWVESFFVRHPSFFVGAGHHHDDDSVIHPRTYLVATPVGPAVPEPVRYGRIKGGKTRRSNDPSTHPSNQGSHAHPTDPSITTRDKTHLRAFSMRTLRRSPSEREDPKMARIPHMATSCPPVVGCCGVRICWVGEMIR